MIDDLKPNTRYEFSVRVTWGDRMSGWSMVVENVTEEAPPVSAPRDLTVTSAPSGDGSTGLMLNWQPPKLPNGKIIGYIIYYTVDETSPLSHWAIDGVSGDKLSSSIFNLVPDTTYYFRIQARNRKGNGPHSSTIAYKTGSTTGQPGTPVGIGSRGLETSGGDDEHNSHTIPMVYIIVGGVGCLIFIILLFICVYLMCMKLKRQNKETTTNNSRKGYGKPGEGKRSARCEKPPDLWMHHDQMELASIMDAKLNDNRTDTSVGGSLSRNSGTDFDRKFTTSSSTLDRSRNFGSQYLSKSEYSFTYLCCVLFCFLAQACEQRQ
jgi:neogenin